MFLFHILFQSVPFITSHFIYEVLSVTPGLWAVTGCSAFVFSPIFVASLNPADLYLMGTVDLTPDYLLKGGGMNPPLMEVSPEELLNLLLGCLRAPNHLKMCLQEDGGSPRKPSLGCDPLLMLTKICGTGLEAVGHVNMLRDALKH